MFDFKTYVIILLSIIIILAIIRKLRIKFKVRGTRKIKISEAIFCFIMAYTIWLVDIGTTLLTLAKHGDKISEANPIQAWFFSFGPLGWIASLITFTTLIWFMIAIFPKFYVKIMNMKPSKYMESFIRIMTTGLIIGGESVVLMMNWNVFKMTVLGG